MTDTPDTLHQIVDNALDTAWTALRDAHHRLSHTDIDHKQHHQSVARELGAVTLPMGTIKRIQHKRESADAELLQILVAERTDLEERLDGIRTEIKDKTLAAIEAGMSEYEAAELANVTRMTIRSWQGK